MSPTLKLLTFPLKHLSLALRLDWVVKVIRLPEIFSTGRTAMGIAHFEEREITILDPYAKLYGQPNPEPSRYLVVLQPTPAADYGIPVAKLPVILEVPLAQVRHLPPAYRQGDTLGIASHVALVPAGEQTQTIFLLDLEALCRAIATSEPQPIFSSRG